MNYRKTVCSPGVQAHRFAVRVLYKTLTLTYYIRHVLCVCKPYGLYTLMSK